MIYNKIRGAKSSLDNYNHREEHVPKEEVRKLKLMQLDEGKYSHKITTMLERKFIIDRENKRLLDKMASIVSGAKTKPHDARSVFNSSKLLPSRQTEMRFNQNRSVMSQKSSLPAITKYQISGTGPHQKSLNIVNRKQEYNRIQNENQRILDRIVNKKAYFDSSKLQMHEVKHKKLLSQRTLGDKVPLAFYKNSGVASGN